MKSGIVAAILASMLFTAPAIAVHGYNAAVSGLDVVYAARAKACKQRFGDEFAGMPAAVAGWKDKHLQALAKLESEFWALVKLEARSEGEFTTRQADLKKQLDIDAASDADTVLGMRESRSRLLCQSWNNEMATGNDLVIQQGMSDVEGRMAIARKKVQDKQ